jgi:ABC-type polysaccharide/polyol phosphate export permease
MRQYLHEILKRKDLMGYLVVSGLKAQHRNSYLGYFWWLLDPLLGVGIYYFLVVEVLKRGSEGYGGYLVVGMVAWRWLSSTVSAAARSISSQAGIVSKVYLPKAIFPFCTAVSQLINFLFSLLLIAAYLLYARIMPGASIFWLPFIMLVQFLLLLAISLIVAYASVFVKDIDNALRHVLRLWFYGSPVIWEPGRLKGYEWLLNANPMSAVLASYRSVFLNTGSPLFVQLAVTGAVSLLLIVFLLNYYSRNEHKIIKVL